MRLNKSLPIFMGLRFLTGMLIKINQVSTVNKKNSN
jgi:hypothetical protein